MKSHKPIRTVVPNRSSLTSFTGQSVFVLKTACMLLGIVKQHDSIHVQHIFAAPKQYERDSTDSTLCITTSWSSACTRLHHGGEHPPLGSIKKRLPFCFKTLPTRMSPYSARRERFGLLWETCVYYRQYEVLCAREGVLGAFIPWCYNREYWTICTHAV